MGSYSDQILGSDLGAGASDLLSDQREAVEKMIRKMGKSGKKKKGKRTKRKLKKLEAQLQVLAADHQRLVKLETKLHKKKKGNKGKAKKNQTKQQLALELQCQQQQLWFQEVMSSAFVKLLVSTTGSMNWPQLPNQPVIELPPPRGQK